MDSYLHDPDQFLHITSKIHLPIYFLVLIVLLGSIAMSSECIKNNENKSRFYVTTKKEELEFYKEKSKYLLSKASPLMTIFKENDLDDFNMFLDKYKNSKIQKFEKSIFKNIDFQINSDKWIIINKKTKPEIHFVIYNDKLINAIKSFLIS